MNALWALFTDTGEYSAQSLTRGWPLPWLFLLDGGQEEGTPLETCVPSSRSPPEDPGRGQCPENKMAAGCYGNSGRRSSVGCGAAVGSQLVPDGQTRQKAALAGRGSCPVPRALPPRASLSLALPCRPGGYPGISARGRPSPPSSRLQLERQGMTASRQKPVSQRPPSPEAEGPQLSLNLAHSWQR